MTGCGAPGAPGIIRCLRKNGERDIRIVAVDRNENAGARDLVDAFYTVPSAEKEDFLPAVLDICRREGVQVVIPIVTRELMKFARSRSEFEAIGAKVSVMEPDKLEIVNNKAHLLDAMRAHGLRTPEYRRVHTVEKLKAAVAAEPEELNDRAMYEHETVIPAMEAARKVADELEGKVGKSYWPMPTYADLLFYV